METIVNSLIYLVGCSLLLLSAFLELSGKTTISRWFQKLFPRWVDWVLFAGGMAFLMSLPDWIDKRMLLVWAGFWGHITIANKERYGEQNG